jgi:hypothetical protein
MCLIVSQSRYSITLHSAMPIQEKQVQTMSDASFKTCMASFQEYSSVLDRFHYYNEGSFDIGTLNSNLRPPLPSSPDYFSVNTSPVSLVSDQLNISSSEVTKGTISFNIPASLRNIFHPSQSTTHGLLLSITRGM